MREAEAIATCLERVPVAAAVRGPGDDAAVLAPPGGNLVWATDLALEGRHFLLELSSLADAAYKAVARNASDLAAMGADPVAFLAGVALPEATDERVRAIADGFREAADAFGLPIVGGDLSRDDRIVFAVSVLGCVAGAGLGRDGARPGDVVVVTGRLGAASAALALHLHGSSAAQELLDAEPSLLARHRRGVARLQAGRVLAGVAHAAIDLSDGLALDAARIATASGVLVQLDRDMLPADVGVQAAADLLAVDIATFLERGGDDYELLATLPPDAVEGIADAIAPLELTVIGSVLAGAPRVIDLEGTPIEGGHDHFA